MYRRILFMLMLSSLFVLAACSGTSTNDEESSNEDSLENHDSNESEEDKDNAKQEDKMVNENEEVNETEEEIDEEVAEESKQETLYKVDENSNIIPLKEETNEKVVLLTIDDVPDENALEMAKTLQELDAPAIFFANGHFLETEEEKDMLRQIHEMGFAIGNHTYSHPNLTNIDEATQKQEIIELNEHIEEIIGEKPKFFRAPHGMNTDYSKQLVENEGMVLMNWTYGYDYFEPYMDKEKLTEAMVSGEGPEVDVPYSLLRPGANLLMHDREWTAAALEDIVTGLREKGYEMVDPMTLELP